MTARQFLALFLAHAALAAYVVGCYFYFVHN